MNVIDLKNISFSYGDKKVLEDLNMTLVKGDRVCIKGESGSGKTTLLKLIAGLVTPDSGTVERNYERLSVCFQEDRLMPFKNVLQNAGFFGYKNDPGKILERLGLSEALKKYPGELSGGMARRVSLARALAFGGDLFIFDEPMTGLDPENILQTAETIRDYTEGASLIMISHREEDAALLGLRVISMEELQNNT